MSLWKRARNLWLISGMELHPEAGKSMSEVVREQVLGQKKATVIDMTPKVDLFANEEDHDNPR